MKKIVSFMILFAILCCSLTSCVNEDGELVALIALNNVFNAIFYPDWDDPNDRPPKEPLVCIPEWHIDYYFAEHFDIEVIECRKCGADNTCTHEDLTYLAPAVAPTCTEIGFTDAYYCNGCGMEIKTVVDCLGHEWDGDACATCGETQDEFLDRFNTTWWYESLADNPNGAAMQEMYRLIDKHCRIYHLTGVKPEQLPVEERNGDWEISYADNPRLTSLSEEECGEVVYAFIRDNPLYCWINILATDDSTHSVGVYFDREYLSDYKYGYEYDKQLASKEVRDAYNELIYTKIAVYNSLIDENDGDYDIARKLFEAIAQTTHYAKDEDGDTIDSIETNTPLGLFTGTGMICSGYSFAYSLLLAQFDVPAIVVGGTTSWGGAHAWSAVLLDNDWYYFDTQADGYWGAWNERFSFGKGSNSEDVTLDASKTYFVRSIVGAAYLPPISPTDYPHIDNPSGEYYGKDKETPNVIHTIPER